jgi:hypothetical protein
MQLEQRESFAQSNSSAGHQSLHMESGARWIPLYLNLTILNMKKVVWAATGLCLILLAACSPEQALPCDGSVISQPYVLTGTPDTLLVSTDEPAPMTWSAAATFCACMAETSGDPWRLPSTSELNALYGAKDVIGGFSDDWYWSATEHNAFNAGQQDFGDGKQNAYAGKDGSGRVRCVQAP